MDCLSFPSFRGLFLTISFLLSLIYTTQAWITYPDAGFASMTHYTLPLDDIASCGCTAASTHYPTAALNEQAFGSSSGYGPACGRCFNLSLLNTFLSEPPFYPNRTNSIVVKITDSCPSLSVWCSTTASKPNPAGHILNFDLAWPSSSIPSDFFPSDESLYGYTDFGVWNISYDSVSCNDDWEGASNPSALGSVTNLGDSVCCPADPMSNPNDTCPSFSDKNGLPPNTASTGSDVFNRPVYIWTWGLMQLAVVIVLYTS